jgi:hypothetical protein
MARRLPELHPTFDVPRDTNPAYNHDRRPAMIYTIRLTSLVDHQKKELARHSGGVR